MIRNLHILLTALLVATHAIAVPLHVVSSHGVGRVHVDAASGMHVHGEAHSSSESHHDDASRLSEVFDASRSGAPHQHAVHLHSMTDHVFSRSRAEDAPVMPVILLPQVEQPVGCIAALPVDWLASPPPQAPCPGTLFLRGPPVG